MQELIDSVSGKISFLLIFPLIGTGLYLTFRLRIVQLLHFGHSWKVLAGIYDDPEHEGDINHLQALSAALSATIGIGNIAGVATAIHFGGPGALFWMWVTAVLGMATKFSEATLAMMHRKIHEDGSASGGPMYYIEMGLGKSWKPLAVIFAFCTIISSFGSGNTVQAFTVADSFRAEFGIPPYITGLITATLVGLVILGGIKRIGVVASRLVPFMAFIYVVCAIAVVGVNYQQIPAAFSLIFNSAFTAQGAVGGFFGSTFSLALLWGVKRGLFSNESGQGSAPIAHAAAKTDEPVREGTVAMIGPFIDTLVICTLTGLTILTTGVWNETYEVELKPEEVFVVHEDTPLGPGAEIAVDEDSLVYPEGRYPFVLFTDSTHCVLMENVVLEEGRGARSAPLTFVGSSTVLDSMRFYAPNEEGDDVLIPIGYLIIDEEGSMCFLNGLEQEIEDVEIHALGLLNGSPLTAQAFATGIGSQYGSLMVTFGVFLFALSTAISWSYYGDRATVYLFGQQYVRIYRTIFVIVHFIGSTLALKTVWGLSDIALSFMAFPNLVALVFLARMIQKKKEEYFKMEHKPVSKIHF